MKAAGFFSHSEFFSAKYFLQDSLKSANGQPRQVFEPVTGDPSIFLINFVPFVERRKKCLKQTLTRHDLCHLNIFILSGHFFQHFFDFCV
jgi:hypothetical protein